MKNTSIISFDKTYKEFKSKRKYKILEDYGKKGRKNMKGISQNFAN